jgi:hypothetical protein
MIPENLLFQVDPILMPFTIGYRNIFFATLFAVIFVLIFLLAQSIMSRSRKVTPTQTKKKNLEYDIDDITSMIHLLKHLLSSWDREPEAYTAREIYSQYQNQTLSSLLLSLEECAYKWEILTRDEREKMASEIEKWKLYDKNHR